MAGVERRKASGEPLGLTLAFGHRGAQFPGGSVSQLGHSQCWGAEGPAKGTRTYCTGQAGPSVIGAGFRAPKISYHMHGQNANAEWMHSWILLAIPSPTVICPCVPRVGERAGAVSRCDVPGSARACPGRPLPSRAAPSVMAGTSRRAGGCCPLAAAPTLRPFAAGRRVRPQNGRWRRHRAHKPLGPAAETTSDTTGLVLATGNGLWQRAPCWEAREKWPQQGREGPSTGRVCQEGGTIRDRSQSWKALPQAKCQRPGQDLSAGQG